MGPKFNIKPEDHMIIYKLSQMKRSRYSYEDLGLVYGVTKQRIGQVVKKVQKMLEEQEQSR